MATIYTYDGGRRPINSGAVDTVTGITNPTQTWLVYTNPATPKAFTTDDDNSNNIDDFIPHVRHGQVYVTGGTVRYLTNNGTPTTAIGRLIADGGTVEFVNQPEILHSMKFITASGTPTVYLFPEG